MKPLPKHFPLIIAITAGVIAAFIYIISGRGSFDNNLQELSKNTAVEKIDRTQNNKILIHCKNGEKYEIVFQENQQNYDDLIFSACGANGAAN